MPLDQFLGLVIRFLFVVVQDLQDCQPMLSSTWILPLDPGVSMVDVSSQQSARNFFQSTLAETVVVILQILSS